MLYITYTEKKKKTHKIFSLKNAWEDKEDVKMHHREIRHQVVNWITDLQ
jgi:hypothetical protein